MSRFETKLISVGCNIPVPTARIADTRATPVKSEPYGSNPKPNIRKINPRIIIVFSLHKVETLFISPPWIIVLTIPISQPLIKLVKMISNVPNNTIIYIFKLLGFFP